MTRFWLLKILRTALTLWFVVTFTFVVLRTSGDPVVALVGADATAEEIEQFRALWRLDDALWLQYLRYIGQMATGQFGISYRDGREVIDIIAERVPWTIMLGVFAYVGAILIGIPAGIFAAIKRGSPFDNLIMATAVFGFAIPNFFLGILLILLFSLALQWLPSSGTGTIWHLLMPALTLATFTAGTLARFTRSAMLEVLDKLYIRAAAAKGVSYWKRIVFHALPNAGIPIITIIGLNLGELIGGAIVVETVFAWPGVGRLLVTAVSSRDLAVVQGLVLVMAVTMVTANLIVDLLYGLLDPRIRVSN
ncbi:ABC transporter permease [Agrobacterium rosae]|uniref:ABC transporter permease n=1 Tax=Agrobacterium rosae TaxID=1972867 RepID=A0A1R3TFX0_9HYPH|nr:ABC transporter permease [Agrobacterium rosae]KAA3515549.1 ABC transporter permease [Agrobacterium rosae]KAA3524514.1 ABC transporter permease [Agrobacterium rosae]MBN7804177.1 ABC transporter permease [Agrobacterium rosae]MCM2431430.1 ABC transporter permease [Agrobacterium rosae]MDX8312548.1 ABC transporter permease [Agrobacterium rosae]